jgi:hypothetical protein
MDVDLRIRDRHVRRDMQHRDLGPSGVVGFLLKGANDAPHRRRAVRWSKVSAYNIEKDTGVLIRNGQQRTRWARGSTATLLPLL